MDLQQHYEQVHQQWLMEQQQQQHNQQLYAQHLQQQNPGRTTPDLHRKRGLANESDEFMGIKKRNLGSEAAAQGMFGFPETGADSPGSIMSTEGAGAQAQMGYFDQQPYFSGSSSAATSPHQGVGLYHQQQMLQANASAPSTPAVSLGNSNNSNNSGTSSLSRSPGSTSIWDSLAQGSHSSPPTPSVATIAGRTTEITANMVASNLMSGTSSTDGSDLQRRLLEEQQMLHDAQQQEQQKLQLAQQWELEQMQRHQQEDQQNKAWQQQMQFQHSPPTVAPIHHDHNDPATWGSYNNVPAAVGAVQFTGYLGGYGKGYTPAAIGGVAALAAVSAMAASRHTPTNGHRGDSGMEMDF
ncbi:hypothetical protein BG015_005532 [Linnemannia schmuckeri]|uniref:Uncharacterized protein n=1 Tax=Linnemannia schmuckeri TaxID=64567 RepID=A0A9P5UWN9_9FUNG|nr:hypothetical protein BG015_005532 [Linnemannia schmuckeri]